MKITVPVSIGELIDKITILEIKSLFTDSEYVTKELEELKQLKSLITQFILDCEVELKQVNESLWKIEDKIRKLEKEQRFDSEFIELARSIYKLNDRRAEIKKEINQRCNSSYKEIKIY